MAAAGSAALLVLLSGLVAVQSIKDGSQVSQCEYPGVVAIVSSDNNLILCNGIRVGGVLNIPELCGVGLEEALTKVPVQMVYGDGTKRVTIPADSKGVTIDGVYKLPISEPTIVDCNTEAVVYTAEKTSSCEVVGYGSDDLSAKAYDGILKAATLTKSTSAPCCRVIFESLGDAEKGPLVDRNVPLNCVVSSGAVCGTGDLGAPVYCKDASGSRVVVGLVATAPCQTGHTFLIHDLTGGAPIKFGVTS